MTSTSRLRGSSRHSDRPIAFRGLEKCIDHGVARHVNAGGVDSFLEQVIPATSCGSEVDRGKVTRDDAVCLLRERGEEISGAQARFDVTEGNLEPGRGERGGQHAGGVALGQHHVRAIGANTRESSVTR